MIIVLRSDILMLNYIWKIEIYKNSLIDETGQTENKEVFFTFF